MSSEHPQIIISDEMLTASVDLMGLIQHQMIDAYIKRERAELAAVTDDYTAWMLYPPTPHDDPAEYEPYWVRANRLGGG